MNRRDFLKNYSLLMTGLTVTNSLGFFPKRLLASRTELNNFSLSIITRHPEKAIQNVEELIRYLKLNLNLIKFSEYVLTGTHIGDIVFLKHNQLINFRTSKDALSQKLIELSRLLELPAPIENPILLKFFTQNKNPLPKHINVYHQNEFIRQFDICSENGEYDLAGSKGHLILSIKEKKVQVISSPCKHKTCIKMGFIDKPGQNLVCIPNQLRVSIEGENVQGVDSLAF